MPAIELGRNALQEESATPRSQPVHALCIDHDPDFRRRVRAIERDGSESGANFEISCVTLQREGLIREEDRSFFVPLHSENEAANRSNEIAPVLRQSHQTSSVTVMASIRIYSETPSSPTT
jgi:hypothetical protein